jgi:hypothetical protein
LPTTGAALGVAAGVPSGAVDVVPAGAAELDGAVSGVEFAGWLSMMQPVAANAQKLNAK